MVRQKMPPEKRAKQFIPFDALKGFSEALRAQEAVKTTRKQLSPDAEEELERELAAIHTGSFVTVIYYLDYDYTELSGEVSGIKDKALFIGENRIELCDIFRIIRRENERAE